jgi:hypothetical protein
VWLLALRPDVVLLAACCRRGAIAQSPDLCPVSALARAAGADAFISKSQPPRLLIPSLYR